MSITYDPDKRARTLNDRGLDFEDAPIVFAGLTVHVPDRHTSGVQKFESA